MKPDRIDRILEQWQRERPDVDAAPMAIVMRVKRLARIFEQATAANFARHGLEPREFDVIATLRRAGPPFQLTAGALGRALAITSGTVTHRIDHLESVGLVRRVDDPDDRRGVRVELTAVGLRKIDTVLVHHLAVETELLAALSEAQCGQLVGLLRRLLHALDDPAPGDGASSSDQEVR